MAAANYPPDIQKILTEFSDNEKQARKLLAGLSNEQLNWQPYGGKAWSILQCIEHLGLSNQQYLDGMKPVLQGITAAKLPRKNPIKAGFLAKLFLSTVEPPAKVKVPTVPDLKPASKGTAEEIMAVWLKTQEQLCAVAASGATIDLNGVRMQNPLGKVQVNVGTALIIIAAHERRHLWQAGIVRQQMEAAGK